MKERHEKIERLIERYYAAQTSEVEERELHAYFHGRKADDDTLREEQVLFQGLAALAEERLPQRSRRARWIPLWTVAAAAALAFGVLLGTNCLRRPYCYIDGVAVYDREVALQTTAYLDGFSGFCNPDELVDELITNK